MSVDCFNTLRIVGPGALACYHAISGEGEFVDLDRIIPTPDILRAIPEGQAVDRAMVILGQEGEEQFIDPFYDEPDAVCSVSRLVTRWQKS